ncbi:hypothetical protein GOBAR_AA36508 [Gossypium barbadense]|uniref:DUF674 domain-containing protein n=1 Tax=Gossypium barbadense TaxID=3634 RepID=A0A2P5VZE1_GOSBA|nr:hypothetical protein GOBAR_AA36508 [Gossypium barbadense]
MAAPTPSPIAVSLKLLIDPITHRFLLAEATKDFVDFLLNIMSLPIGTVIRLLNKQGTVGCIGNIYDSIENLSESYMLKALEKDILLKPTVMNYSANVALLLPSMVSLKCTKLYITRCPCWILKQNSNFVKRVMPYMVMDDLTVRPLSAKSIITLLNHYNIKDLGDLEEKVIAVGVNEGLELLRASMLSKTVLTDVFLGVKKKISVKSELLFTEVLDLMINLFKPG